MGNNNSLGIFKIMKKETYEEYKIRKGIVNEYQANIELGLDAIRIISKIIKRQTD